MHSAVSPASATRARAMSATLWAVAALSLGAAWVHFAYMQEKKDQKNDDNKKK